jgi:WD40 repeat protein
LSAADADFVLKDRGSSQALEEFVVSTAFMRGGIAAFALGDGTLRLATAGGAWTTIEAHDGGILAMAAAGDSVVTGGDDGRFCRISADGAVQEMAKFGSKWVEQVAAWSDGKAALLACGVGKTVHLFDGTGKKLKELPHPATVAGIAFDAKGKRVAAAHYGGATLWFVGAKVDSPRLLEWKGSHIGIAIHPGSDAVVTSMQENALHGWRLADGQHMRMSGYPAKTESMSFSRNGKWLATSGAESIVMWPFFGGGPMGKAPTELAGGDDVQCTRVAFHPQSEMVAAGFSDGLVVVADVPSQRILPMAAPGRGPVSALAWSPDGTRLAFGTEQGFAALVDLSKR